MEIAALSGVIAFLLLVGGVGWKLHSELSSIRTILEVFIAKTEGKLESILKLEVRIEKLENRMHKHEVCCNTKKD